MHAHDVPERGLLAGVPWEAVAEVLGDAPVRDVEAGHVLATPGEAEGPVFLVLGGQVAVRVSGRDDETVNVLGPGEPVGELSALDGGPRSAWVVVEQRARVAEIARADFLQLVRGSHAVTLNLLHLVAQRIRGSNAAIESRGAKLARTERAGFRDALTGVFNRRWFEQHGPRLAVEATETDTALSMAMLDVDHFKRINDTLGHPAGDAVLAEVGRQLRQRVRLQDMVVRYGGEEFALLLPGTDLAQATEVAERVRKALAFTGVPCAGGHVVRFTVSAGVACLRPGETLLSLVSRADAALYGAKEGGRDQVVADTGYPGA